MAVRRRRNIDFAYRRVLRRGGVQITRQREYKPGDSRGGLGERDKAPGAIISNNSYKSKSRRNSSVEPDQSRRGTATTSAEAGDRVTTSPRGAPPASARARIFGFFGWLASPQHSNDACSVG